MSATPVEFICSVLFPVVGLVLFVYNRESIVIANRRPNMVIIDSAFVFVNLIFSSDLSFIPGYYENMSCEFYQSVYSVAILMYMGFSIARMTFTYKYLMKKNDSPLCLLKLCDLFWDKNNRLKRNNLIIFLVSIEFVAFSFTSVVTGVVFAIANRGFDGNNVKVQAWVSIVSNLYFPIIVPIYIFQLL